MDHDHDNLPHSIGDGYTRKGYLKADKGFHGALRFRYRPMLAVIRQEYLFLINAANLPRGEQRIGDSAALIGLAIDVITKQCQQLTLTNPAGKSVSVISDGAPVGNVRTLVGEMEPNLLFKLRDVCLGVTPPDEEPVPVIPGRSELPCSVDQDALLRRLEGNGDPIPGTTVAAEADREGKSAGN